MTTLLRSEIPAFTEKDRKIAKITTVPGEVYFVKGIDLHYETSIGVRRCGGLGWTKAVAPIASVEVMTEAEYLALFVPMSETFGGSHVFVPKYGSTYSGRVEEVGRTRVMVRFLTVAGKVKRFSFPVSDVGLLAR